MGTRILCRTTTTCRIRARLRPSGIRCAGFLLLVYLALFLIILLAGPPLPRPHQLGRPEQDLRQLRLRREPIRVPRRGSGWCPGYSGALRFLSAFRLVSSPPLFSSFHPALSLFLRCLCHPFSSSPFPFSHSDQSSLTNATHPQGVNPFLLIYLGQGTDVHAEVHRTGVLMLDFPGGGLINKILSFNANL